MHPMMPYTSSGVGSLPPPGGGTNGPPGGSGRSIVSTSTFISSHSHFISFQASPGGQPPGGSWQGSSKSISISGSPVAVPTSFGSGPGIPEVSFS